MRMTIRKQSDGTLLIRAIYGESDTHTGPAMDAVVASSEPLRMPWEKGPAMKMASASLRKPRASQVAITEVEQQYFKWS